MYNIKYTGNKYNNYTVYWDLLAVIKFGEIAEFCILASFNLANLESDQGH